MKAFSASKFRSWSIIEAQICCLSCNTDRDCQVVILPASYSIALAPTNYADQDRCRTGLGIAFDAGTIFRINVTSDDQ